MDFKGFFNVLRKRGFDFLQWSIAENLVFFFGVLKLRNNFLDFSKNV